MFRIPIFLPLLAIALVACATTHRQSRDDLPEKEREVAELQGLLESFDEALSKNEFSDAKDILDELETGIKEAGTVTIMHRNYPLVQERVNKGPKRLKEAKRTFALTNVINKGRELLDRASTLTQQIATDGPTDDILSELDDVVSDLQQNQEEAASFARDSRYQAQGEETKNLLASLAVALPVHRWALEATTALNNAVEDVQAALTSTELNDRIERADDEVEAYADCLEAADKVAAERHHDPERVLVTLLGRHTLAQSQALCEEKRAGAEATAANLRWQSTATAIAASVTESLIAVEKAQGPTQIGDASELAVEKLRECEKGLSPERPGFDAEHRIKSHLGTHAAGAMAEVCVKVAVNLEKKLPTLRWRARAQRLQDGAKDAEKKLAAAKKEKEKDDAADLAKEALAGFESCASEAAELTTRKDASLRDAKPNRKELRSMGKFAKSCKKRQSKVKALLAKLQG